MATSDNITPENIDETYPIAGQDNDSQGFRDNFATIQSSLTATKTALKDIEAKGVFKTALADGSLDNDLQGSTITNGVLKGVASEHFNTGNITQNAEANILWTTAEYHDITMANPSSVRLSLGGWPAAGTYGRMRLAIRSNNGSARTITFEAANAGTLRVNSTNLTSALSGGDFIVTSATSPKIVDVWTVDGGITVFMEYAGEYTILS